MKIYRTALPYFPRQDITSILKEIKDILAGRDMLTMGRKVLEFEKAFAHYVGTKYAVALNSCTSALELVLKCIGLNSEDEVIVPAQTFIATGSSVIWSGGRIKFVDVDRNFLIDFGELKKKISRRTKAVIMVHFAGLIHPEIFEIRDYLKKRNIYLIEDAAHAPGASIMGHYSGSIGDFGCFSFFATKIITTAEGGMITTNDERCYRICNSLRNRGLDLDSKTELFSAIGSNRRFTEIQAILGLYQLKRIEEFVRHRNRVAKIYKDFLKPFKDQGMLNFQEYPDTIRHAYWRFIVFMHKHGLKRKLIKNKMALSGIVVDWPYQPLLHLQPVFRKMLKIRKNSFPQAESLANNHICLPVHYGIRVSDARFIAKTFAGYLK